MDEHYGDIISTQIQAEYWERREGDFEPKTNSMLEHEDLTDDYLTLFNEELHQEYWGDDEGYLLAQQLKEKLSSS